MPRVRKVAVPRTARPAPDRRGAGGLLGEARAAGSAYRDHGRCYGRVPPINAPEDQNGAMVTQFDACAEDYIPPSEAFHELPSPLRTRHYSPPAICSQWSERGTCAFKLAARQGAAVDYAATDGEIESLEHPGPLIVHHQWPRLSREVLTPCNIGSHVGHRSARMPGLEGEDLESNRWEDARHWIGIYTDLLRFKVGVLDRVRRELPRLRPIAREAASADLGIIENQMHGYEVRLDLWYHRLWELRGLRLEADGPMLYHRGEERRLTKREYQLLQFLLDHPNRFFSASQLVTQAWADAALYPEEARNYVRRIRKILTELDIPCDLVNRPGRGYSLIYRHDS